MISDYPILSICYTFQVSLPGSQFGMVSSWTNDEAPATVGDFREIMTFSNPKREVLEHFCGNYEQLLLGKKLSQAHPPTWKKVMSNIKIKQSLRREKNGRETNGARQPAPGHLAPDIWRFGHLAPGQLALWTIGTQDIWLLDIWL